MTVGGWFLFIITIGLALLLLFGLWASKHKVLGVVFFAAIVVAVWFSLQFYFNNTASGARALKTQESNFSKGLERVVKVYDAEGELIQQYNGKLDVDYDDNRIVFDDEEGKRHIIYYPTGTVIVDEV